MFHWISTRATALIPLGFSILIAAYLTGDNLSARWWLIDDHELFYMAGDLGRAPTLSEIPAILSTKTEIGQFGKYPRYRPSYYFVRILELNVWKFRVSLWYAFRVFILMFFILSIWCFSRKYLDAVPSYLFTLLIIAPAYWSDIFARLGPAEIYGALGLGIILISLPSALERKHRSLPHIAIAAAILLAAGTKENMVLLAALPGAFLLFRWRYLSLPVRIVYFLTIVYCAWIAWAVFLWMKLAYGQSITDVNGTSLRLNDRMKMLVYSLTETHVVSLGIAIGLIAMLKIRFLPPGSGIFNGLKGLFPAVVSWVIILLNVVFYGGKWPTGMRYDFPGLLLWNLGLLMLLPVALSLYPFRKLRDNWKTTVFLSVCLLLSIDFNGLGDFRRHVQKNADRTILFTRFLDNLRNRLDENTAIVALANTGGDIETAGSLFRYLHFYRTPGSRHVFVANLGEKDRFQLQLLNEMRNWQRRGYAESDIRPYAEASQRQKGCIVVEFYEKKKGEPYALPDCRIISHERAPW